MKKLTGLILTIILACTAMTGCANNAAGTPTPDPTKEVQTEETVTQTAEQTEEPATTEPEASEEPTGLEIGDKIIDFEFHFNEGGKASIRDYEGKVVFLNFWAIFCGPCVAEMPNIQKLHEEYGDEVEVIAINVTEGYDEISGFIKDRYTFTIGRDKPLGNTFGIKYIPTTYVIDKDGIITYGSSGDLSFEKMEELVKAAGAVGKE